MRIGIQGPRKNPRIAGGATFEQELFEGILVALAESRHTLVVFSQHPRPPGLVNGDKVEWVRLSGISWRNAAASFRRIVNLGVNRLLVAPSPFRHEHWIDAYLLAHRVEFFLNLIPETIPTEVPFMTFIWDLMHRSLPYFPECSQRGAWVRRESQLGMMTRRAAILGVGTQIGKRDLMKHYQVGEDRIRVLPFPTPRFALQAPAGHPARRRVAEPYVFYPASFHAHKNHVTVLRALALLRDRHGVKLHAVFTGGDWGNLAHVKNVAAELGLAGEVHFLDFVSREELAALYQGAEALVFASLLGPDNIPPLEAFGLGCPALVAAIPGAAEQTAGAALLFPPTDVQTLAEMLRQLGAQPELRQGLIEKGRARARQFTNDTIGADTLQVISEFAAIRRCWGSTGHYPSRYNWVRLLGR